MAMNKEEAAQILARIRELIAKGKTDQQIARTTGRGRSTIALIRLGKRRGPNQRSWGMPPPVTIASLNIIVYEFSVKCKNCEVRVNMVAQSGCCLDCEVSILEKKGLLTLTHKETRSGNGSLPSS